MNQPSIHHTQRLCPLAPNDIIQLAHFFQHTLQHFSQCQSSCEGDYLASILIILDCYSLVLLEGGYLTTQDDHLNSLRRYEDFKEHPDLINKLSVALADMINTIAEKARLLDQPWFYPHFITAVKNTLKPKVTYLYGDIELARHLQNSILNHKIDQ